MDARGGGVPSDAMTVVSGGRSLSIDHSVRGPLPPCLYVLTSSSTSLAKASMSYMLRSRRQAMVFSIASIVLSTVP